MSNRVYASANNHQHATIDPDVHLPGVETRLQELLAADHSLLAPREAQDQVSCLARRGCRPRETAGRRPRWSGLRLVADHRKIFRLGLSRVAARLQRFSDDFLSSGVPESRPLIETGLDQAMSTNRVGLCRMVR